MHAKKLLALALAGMALTTCLSGCDRTIIEHQFHTNTITDTVIEEIPVETGRLYGFQEIIALFEEHGIKCNSEGQFGIKASDYNKTIDEIIGSYNERDVGAFYEQPDRVNIAASVKSDVDLLMYLDDLQYLADQVYRALKNYMDSNEWDWNQFKENLNDRSVKLCAMVFVGYNEEQTAREVCATVLLNTY